MRITKATQPVYLLAPGFGQVGKTDFQIKDVFHIEFCHLRKVWCIKTRMLWICAASLTSGFTVLCMVEGFYR